MGKDRSTPRTQKFRGSLTERGLKRKDVVIPAHREIDLVELIAEWMLEHENRQQNNNTEG
jgi:hypothetical protein